MINYFVRVRANPGPHKGSVLKFLIAGRKKRPYSQIRPHQEVIMFFSSNSRLLGETAPHSTSSFDDASRQSSSSDSALLSSTLPVTTDGIQIIPFDSAKISLHVILPYSQGTAMRSEELPDHIGFEPIMTCTLGGSPAKVVRAMRAPCSLGLAIELPEGMVLSDLERDQELFLCWEGTSGLHSLKYQFHEKKG